MTSVKNIGPLKKVAFLRNRYVDGTLWFIATSRNAIAVILGCLAAYLLEQNGLKPFALTGIILFCTHYCYNLHFILQNILLIGDIKAGLPPFELPQFTMNRTEGNSTIVMSFGDICSELGAAIGLIPLIAILEQVAIAKAFGKGIVRRLYIA